MVASQAISTERTRTRIDRFLDAEQRLWEHYGLKPVDRSFDIGSRHIRVQEVGAGKPIVFIHGTGGSGAYFAPLVRELSGFRSLLVDRPGWGLSSPVAYPPGGFTRIADGSIRDVFDGLGLERAHIVGASVGGLWALRFALANPQSVDRLALLGAGPFLDELPLPRFARLLRSPLGQILMRIPERRAILHKQLGGLGHGPSLEAGRIPEAFIDWRIAASRETQWRRAERDMIRAITTRSGFLPGTGLSDADVGGIRPATLMVLGTSDPNGSVDMWRRFTERMPNGELAVVGDGGHLVWYDDPTGVGRRVGEFLG